DMIADIVTRQICTNPQDLEGRWKLVSRRLELSRTAISGLPASDGAPFSTSHKLLRCTESFTALDAPISQPLRQIWKNRKGWAY
ncbi:MAG: hypothetical protein KGQ60_00600, partial [Planctomycetes bacterium]|nr:hypothetical protein [Planctomycetota bacterium]